MLPLVCTICATAQLRRIATKIDVGKDRLGLEDHAVVVDAHSCAVDLLGEEGHVVGQAEEMLLVLLRASLAGDGHSQSGVVIAEGAEPLYAEDIVAGDAVVKDHTP